MNKKIVIGLIFLSIITISTITIISIQNIPNNQNNDNESNSYNYWYVEVYIQFNNVSEVSNFSNYVQGDNENDYNYASVYWDGSSYYSQLLLYRIVLFDGGRTYPYKLGLNNILGFTGAHAWIWSYYNAFDFVKLYQCSVGTYYILKEVDLNYELPTGRSTCLVNLTSFI